MAERRVHPRERVRGEVSYEGSPQLRCEEVYDLSAGGMRLVLSGPEETGRDVQLRIEGEGGAITVARGRVVWARQAAPFQVGIRFLDAGSSFVDSLKER